MGSGAGVKPKLGVVEDDRYLCQALVRMLKIHGYPTTGFAGADELLADRPSMLDCLVVDYHLPGMTGLELLQELELRGQSVPAILISGRVDDDLDNFVCRRTTAPLLRKPVDGAILISHIEAAVGNKG